MFTSRLRTITYSTAALQYPPSIFSRAHRATRHSRFSACSFGQLNGPFQFCSFGQHFIFAPADKLLCGSATALWAAVSKHLPMDARRLGHVHGRGCALGKYSLWHELDGFLEIASAPSLPRCCALAICRRSSPPVAPPCNAAERIHPSTTPWDGTLSAIFLPAILNHAFTRINSA